LDETTPDQNYWIIQIHIQGSPTSFSKAFTIGSAKLLNHRRPRIRLLTDPKSGPESSGSVSDDDDDNDDDTTLADLVELNFWNALSKNCTPFKREAK
jgi:hypothetical protein